MTENTYQPEVVEFDKEEQGQVEALTKSRPFFQLGDDGQPVRSGRIGLTDMGDGNSKARKMFYLSESGHEHPLGVMTKQFRIHDNFQILSPIYEAGFTTKALEFMTRGGAGTITMLTNPTLEYPDYLKWDESFHDGEHKPLNPGILVWADAREGRAYKFMGGFIRWFCTNGLVSSYLGLGTFQQSHKDADPAGIHEFATLVAQRASQWKEPPSFSGKALEFPRDVIHKQIIDPGSWQRQPRFVQEPMSSIQSILPNWGWEALHGQLDMMVNDTGDVTIMDIVNAITNLNKGRNTYRIYSKLERMTSNIMRLAELGAWKNDVEWPDYYTKGIQDMVEVA